MHVFKIQISRFLRNLNAILTRKNFHITVYIAIISKILFIFHFYPSILTIIFFKIEKEWFVQLDEAVRIYFVLS